MSANEQQRNLTLRLTETQARALEKVAQIDGVPMTEAIRTAIAAHIDARRADPEFQRRVTEIIEQDRQILEQLKP